jgi:putative SOS response-associated peptidase YedK
MCGRFTLTSEEEVLRDAFGLDHMAEDYRPRYNIAPTQPVLALAGQPEGAPRTGTLLWGLVPWWTEGSPSERIINVRAETLARKFRHHFERRRCVIPADGFYEWQRTDGAKIPMRIHRPDDRPFAFAGIWDRWKVEGKEPLYTCAIVTTRATPALAPIHARMPVVLNGATWKDWLRRDASADDLARMLGPADTALVAYRVSTFVNSARNDEPACIAPIDAGPDASQLQP